MGDPVFVTIKGGVCQRCGADLYAAPWKCDMHGAAAVELHCPEHIQTLGGGLLQRDDVASQRHGRACYVCAECSASGVSMLFVEDDDT